MAKRFNFPMPATVSEETKKFMRNVIRELRDNMTLEIIDAGALNMLMTSYEMYKQATEALLHEGPTLVNFRGDQIPNPNQAIASKNYNQVLAIMKEYGLTVKARKNLKMNIEVEETSPLAEFLKK